MKTRSLLFVSIAALFAIACEDGPEQVFIPLPVDTVPAATSGTTWTPEGTKDYTTTSGGDAVGRARFCDEDEAETQIREMVMAPIIPDVSVGTIPLLDANGEPYLADELLGRPEDGKYCDPTGVYSDAFVWGPTNEVIVFFDVESRIVEAVMAYQSYLGTLEGNMMVDGEAVPIVIKPRERITIGGRELTEYAGSFDRNRTPDSFLNEANVTQIYDMIRQTFFGDMPVAPGFNCVEENRCRIVYTAPDQQSNPQDAFIVLEDSGIQIRMTPDGYVTLVYVQPVNKAPFEIQSSLRMLDDGDNFRPVLTSTSQAGCTIDIAADATWADFKANCIDSDSTLGRITYNVHTMRDAVQAAFNGVDVVLRHKVSELGVLGDGEAPNDADTLYQMTWTLSMTAPIAEFIPNNIARGYRSRLRARLRGAVDEGAREGHPIAEFDVDVPQSIRDQIEGQALDVIAVDPPDDSTNWVKSIIADVIDTYDNLSPAQRAVTNERVGNHIFLIEPLVETVLDELTGGRSVEDSAFVALRSTDNQNWSIGYAHFVQDGIAYRMTVQFSNSYGAITAVTVSRGYSEVDAIYASLNPNIRSRVEGADDYPYYTIALANADPESNPYALGGDAITISGFDRQLDTIDVSIKTISDTGAVGRLSLTVPGAHIRDRNGFLKTIAGERFEFVPASLVRLLGKETLLDFYVAEDGKIARVSEYLFKGPVKLCDGPVIFPPAEPEVDPGGDPGEDPPPAEPPAPEPIDTTFFITYGDDIPQRLEAWREVVGDDVYQECQLLFNYSDDGHVLDAVLSLKSKVSFVTVAERAVTVTVWQ